MPAHRGSSSACGRSRACWRFFYPKLQDESYLAYLDILGLNLRRPGGVRRGKVPMLVLGGRRDRTFTVKEVKRTAAAYDADIELFPDLAHDLMLDPGWPVVASVTAIDVPPLSPSRLSAVGLTAAPITGVPTVPKSSRMPWRWPQQPGPPAAGQSRLVLPGPSSYIQP